MTTELVISGENLDDIPLDDAWGALEMWIYTFALTGPGLSRLLETVSLTPGAPIRILSCQHATHSNAFDVIEKLRAKHPVEFKVIDVPSHAKALLFPEPDKRFGVFGSFNITRSSLTRNVEFSAVVRGPAFEELLRFFELRWAKGVEPSLILATTRVELIDELASPAPGTEPSPDGTESRDDHQHGGQARHGHADGDDDVPPLFDVQRFLDDLDVSDAPSCINAAQALGERHRTKQDALTSIERMFSRRPVTNHRATAEQVLRALGFEEVRDWAFVKDLVDDADELIDDAAAWRQRSSRAQESNDATNHVLVNVELTRHRAHRPVLRVVQPPDLGLGLDGHHDFSARRISSPMSPMAHDDQAAFRTADGADDESSTRNGMILVSDLLRGALHREIKFL